MPADAPARVARPPRGQNWARRRIRQEAAADPGAPDGLQPPLGLSADDDTDSELDDGPLGIKPEGLGPRFPSMPNLRRVFSFGGMRRSSSASQMENTARR